MNSWGNTLAGQRKAKLEAKKLREEREEEIRKKEEEKLEKERAEKERLEKQKKRMQGFFGRKGSKIFLFFLQDSFFLVLN